MKIQKLKFKTWHIFIAAPIIGFGAAAVYTAWEEAEAQRRIQQYFPPIASQHDHCRYPYRASNPPGGCDNSDIACPLEIKGGSCEGYVPTTRETSPWIGSQ
jgi:hypothetical protein